MIIDQLDAALRVATVTTVLLLAWLLFRNRRQAGLHAALFVPLAICLSAFVIENTQASTLRLSGVASSVAHMLSGYAVIFLWWFCLSCFDSRFRPRSGILAVGLIWAAIAAVDRGAFGATLADKGLSALLVTLGFGIVGHLVWRLVAERSGDLIQWRHDARIMVAVLLGGNLFIDLAADTLFGFAWRPPAFAMTQNSMVLAFALWLAGTLLAVRPDVLTFGAAAEVRTIKQGATPAARREDELHRRLTALIDTQRIFLDPDLTFASFVERMGAPERIVRKLINHDLGYDHFRTFLNHHRVAEARRQLSDPLRDGDKLITIGLDSGFASLASFNRAFRSAEGCSPGEFRALASRKGPDDAPRLRSGASAGF